MFHRSPTSLTALLAGLLLLASACTGGATDKNADDATPTTDLSSDEIILTAGLNTVDSCDALLNRLKAEGLERVGPYGFGEGGYHIFEGDDVMEEDAAADAMSSDAMADGDFDGAEQSFETAASTDDSAGAEGGDFSGTNVQEGGVDEADRVKTDGRRLVAAGNGHLTIVDVTGDEPRLERSVELPEEVWEGELFLVGDSALLMSQGWTETPFIEGDAEGAADLSWFPGSPTARIFEIDLNSGEIKRTLEFEGGYLSAREIDGSIRIVLTAGANRFNFLFPSNRGAEDQAEKANRDIIEESTIEQWIPTYRLTEGDSVIEQGPIVECDRVHLPGEFAGFGSVVVLTADVDDGLTINDSLSVYTDANTVYASTDRLVVATPRWPEYDRETGEPLDDETYRTALHTFDISDPDSASYNASGSVIGTLLSRYSMSEYEGHLRVATTDGTPWDSRGSESFVTVFEERDGALESVGQVGGLGEGETIFAVRFMGDVGYVVTFEQVDPLYVVDLSDPTNPTVEGELKIPGFSSYLHPVGDGKLLGIGTDGTDDGQIGGTVASLFDVSDPNAPALVDKIPLGPEVDLTDPERQTDSYTPVAHDPRAFTYWEDTALIPVGWWRWSEDEGEQQGSSVELITVDGDTLVSVGQIRPPAYEECEDGRGPIPVEPNEAPATEPADDATEADTTEAETTDTTGSETEDAEASFVVDDEEEPADIAIEEGPGNGERYCWRYQPEVNRTVIVDGTLYSVTWEGVAAHDFDTLDEIAWLPFERR